MLDKNYIQDLISARKHKTGPKPAPNQIDYNNGMNILSKIEDRIEIKYHKHPLIYGNHFIINPNEIKRNWFCEKCKQSYDITIPSFFCTFCINYNFCQSCFLKLKVKEVKQIYNDNNNESVNECSHEKKPIKIKINKEVQCNKCKKYLNFEYDYCKYCSFCNYILCKNCLEIK